MVEGLGKRLSLSCDRCQHSAMVDVRAFAEQHGPMTAAGNNG